MKPTYARHRSVSLFYDRPCLARTGFSCSVPGDRPAEDPAAVGHSFLPEAQLFRDAGAGPLLRRALDDGLGPLPFRGGEQQRRQAPGIAPAPGGAPQHPAQLRRVFAAVAVEDDVAQEGPSSSAA